MLQILCKSADGFAETIFSYNDLIMLSPGHIDSACSPVIIVHLLDIQLKWFMHCCVQSVGEGKSAGQETEGGWACAKARHARMGRVRWI